MGGIPVVSGLNDHQLAVLVVLAVIFQVGILLKLHSTAKDAKAANDQTTATGNGFAKHVLEKLDLLRDSSEILRDSMKSVAGKQDEQRNQLDFVREYIQRVDRRLQDHMAHHINKENDNA